jgi:hypothetical protein
MKKFIAGLIAGILLTCSVSFAATNLTAVKSAFATVFNGKSISQNIVTIDGMYYADLKQLAGNLGIKYTIDAKGKKIVLGETPVTNKFNMSNPAPIGTIQTVKFDSMLSKFTANVTVKEVARGAAADSLIEKESMLNGDPGAGFEYLLVKINFTLTGAPEGKKYDLSGYSFDLISSKGKSYSEDLLIAPDPTLSSELYKNASTEGYVLYKVAIDDKAPKIAFGRNYDGTGGIWFKAY